MKIIFTKNWHSFLEQGFFISFFLIAKLNLSVTLFSENVYIRKQRKIPKKRHFFCRLLFEQHGLTKTAYIFDTFLTYKHCKQRQWWWWWRKFLRRKTIKESKRIRGEVSKRIFTAILFSCNNNKCLLEKTLLCKRDIIM